MFGLRPETKEKFEFGKKIIVEYHIDCCETLKISFI